MPKGTAWGLLNAVAEYVDHEKRARSTEHRMDSAWFGQGAVMKQRALEAAFDLVALRAHPLTLLSKHSIKNRRYAD